MSDGASAAFDGVLTAHGNNTGILVPPEVIEQLGAGRRPAVRVDVNGHVFRSTVGVMSGDHLIGFSAALRNETGLAAGDAIHVVLTVDASPRAVELTPELAAALDAEPAARAFFDQLSNSLQRYHAEQVSSAKTDETRDRRIAKAVGLFLSGKPR